MFHQESYTMIHPRTTRPTALVLAACLLGAVVGKFNSRAALADGPKTPIARSIVPYGHDYFALRGGLENCRIRFEREKAGRVAFLGGSITEGDGWRNLVCKDLQARFPDTKFDFINAGISSTGSTPGAFRLLRDVFARGQVDLLFEEAAVNDDTNAYSDAAQIRGMEGIVRHARQVNPEIDIVLLHFVDPGKMKQINAGQTPAVIANHEKVANYYQAPSIDLARKVTERIRAGEFTWEKDFRDLHPAAVRPCALCPQHRTAVRRRLASAAVIAR